MASWCSAPYFKALYASQKGHGGLKQTVRQFYDALGQYAFVCKTDVKGFYESIGHALLLQQLSPFLPDKQVWRLIYHYVHRVVERGGNFSDINRGNCRGCPLSPVMAALYLLPLDNLMTQKGVFYRRYMDDIIIFCKRRWQLRQAVAQLNQQLTLLKLTKAPDKTFIGAIERGFSFLGYLFSGGLLQPAEKTMQKYRCRLAQLYEQKKGQSNRPALLASYQQRWLQWVYAGLEPSVLCHAFMQQFYDDATANRINLKRIC